MTTGANELREAVGALASRSKATLPIRQESARLVLSILQMNSLESFSGMRDRFAAVDEIARQLPVGDAIRIGARREEAKFIDADKGKHAVLNDEERLHRTTVIAVELSEARQLYNRNAQEHLAISEYFAAKSGNTSDADTPQKRKLAAWGQLEAITSSAFITDATALTPLIATAGETAVSLLARQRDPSASLFHALHLKQVAQDLPENAVVALDQSVINLRRQLGSAGVADLQASCSVAL